MFTDMGNNRTKNGFAINNDNFGGFNNQNTLGNKRTQQDELNEANESLKSLRLKINNGNSQGNAFTQPSNNLGNNKFNTLTSNNNTNSNDNYRKPFKPNVDGDFGMNSNNKNNGNLIDINKNSFNNNNNNLNTNKGDNMGINQAGRLNNVNANNNKNVSLYNLLFNHNFVK